MGMKMSVVLSNTLIFMQHNLFFIHASFKRAYWIIFSFIYYIYSLSFVVFGRDGRFVGKMTNVVCGMVELGSF